MSKTAPLAPCAQRPAERQIGHARDGRSRVSVRLMDDQLRDVGDVSRRLKALLERPDPPLMTLVHVGAPLPKARARRDPRSDRWYTPAANEAAETDLAWRFRVVHGSQAPYLQTLGLLAIFYLPTRRWIDADNLMKLVMDAATRAHVWRDDSQVIVQASVLEYDPVHPRTVVALASAQSSLQRNTRTA